MIKYKFLILTLVFFPVIAFSASIGDPDGPQPRPGKVYFLNDDGIPTEALLDGINPNKKLILERDIKFYLYTKQTPQEYQLFVDDVNNLKASPFKSKRKTKLIVHGFSNSYNSPVIQDLKDEYLKHHDYNVIGIDWEKLARSPWYYSATTNTMDVAKYTARLIDNMVLHLGLKMADVHFLGHSLGAHIAGITGKHVSFGKIARITAFDAALPLYELAREKWRVTKNDADFVNSIHTNGGDLGFLDPVGHVDFYPNGGKSQPGCGMDLTGSCSHSRSYLYYIESIARKEAFPTKECKTLSEAKKEKCSIESDVTPMMGEHAFKVNGATGLYHTKTNKQFPFNMV